MTRGLLRVYIWALIGIFAVGTAAIHCGATLLPAQYAAELEFCLTSSLTCEDYVACRKEVAERYGRTFNATCKDAGHD